MVRIIRKNESQRLIGMTEAIRLVEEAFAGSARAQASLPLRTVIAAPKHHGSILYMPAYLPDSEAMGCKVVSVYPDNRNKQKPTIYSTLLLNDATTGEPIALIDGEYITALRTGAISGVAAKYLSRKDAETMSVFGAGVQARTQLEAICAVRKIKRAFVFDLDEESARRYCTEMAKQLQIEVVCGAKRSEALAQSQIIVTATTAKQPVFEAEEVALGTFVSGVGSYTPQTRELPEGLMVKGQIVVDTYAGALEEAGDILIPMQNGSIRREEILAELSEVIGGNFVRTDDRQIIVFKTVGTALQDLCIAQFVYRRAAEENQGIVISLN